VAHSNRALDGAGHVRAVAWLWALSLPRAVELRHPGIPDGAGPEPQTHRGFACRSTFPARESQDAGLRGVTAAVSPRLRIESRAPEQHLQAQKPL